MQADIILRAAKELATPKEEFISESGVKHEFNVNTKLNQLNLKVLKKTGQLNEESEGYTLDYDNQVIPTEKYDACRTYKHCAGYQPGIASIEHKVVYLEGCNGNSQAKYKQGETLARMFRLLEKESIKTKRFRADSASFQKAVVNEVKKHCEYFYIRAMRCATFEELVGEIKEWKKIRLGVQEMEVASVNSYCPFGGKTPYRLVVSRIKRTDKQADMFTGEAYTYRGILTNDYEWDDAKVVSFYVPQKFRKKTNNSPMMF